MTMDYVKQYSESDYRYFHLFDDEYYSNDLHCHDFIEIYLCISGGKHFLLNDKMYDMKKGDLFVVKNLDIHRIVREDNVRYERFVLEYKPAFVLPFCTAKTDLLHYIHSDSDSGKKISLADDQFEYMLSIFEAYEKLNDKNYGNDIKRQLHFLEILVYIANILYNASSENDIHSGNFNSTISLLLTYIKENLTGDLCLDNLALHANMNKHHLCKLFKKNTGITINRYISSKRIAQAKKMLILGDSVTEAAAKSGFNSLSHFIRTFNQMTGMSPTAYIKRESGN